MPGIRLGQHPANAAEFSVWQQICVSRMRQKEQNLVNDRNYTSYSRIELSKIVDLIVTDGANDTGAAKYAGLGWELQGEGIKEDDLKYESLTRSAKLSLGYDVPREGYSNIWAIALDDAATASSWVIPR